MSILKRVQLTERHLNPGRTRHTLIDGNGSRAFSAFTSLEIVQFEDNPGFYLMHLCADGTGTDTWHETVDDALHQAEWELDVRRDEWEDVGDAN